MQPRLDDPLQATFNNVEKNSPPSSPRIGKNIEEQTVEGCADCNLDNDYQGIIRQGLESNAQALRNDLWPLITCEGYSSDNKSEQTEITLC